MSAPKAIETSYAGCRFRSRLEAKWAVFFDALEIAWEYEPQGYLIDVPGRGPIAYLPDFKLEDGTWVEVKGSETQLDKPLLTATSEQLGGLLILGPIPKPQRGEGDWGWPIAGELHSRYGFGPWRKDQRLWFLDNAQAGADAPWLNPVWDPYETNCAPAYEAARSARFEHGQSGPYRGTS